MTKNTDFLGTALAAARAGAEVLREKWGQARQVEEKSRFDFVTDADRASQEAVLAVIEKRHPGHDILAEESAGDFSQARNAPGPLWVVDPLDGTTNFIHHYPQVSVSVAVVQAGEPLAGVVMDVTRGEVFSAVRGGGAWLDGRPIAVSRVREPGRALLLTGFPFRDKERLAKYLELFAELFQQVSGVRRAGSAALDLAYVACGRAEGFWETGLQPWDLAAGLLLLTEAGGRVSDYQGGANALWRGDVAAAGPQLHPWLRAACFKHFPEG